MWIAGSDDFGESGALDRVVDAAGRVQLEGRCQNPRFDVHGLVVFQICGGVAQERKRRVASCLCRDIRGSRIFQELAGAIGNRWRREAKRQNESPHCRHHVDYLYHKILVTCGACCPSCDPIAIAEI